MKKISKKNGRDIFTALLLTAVSLSANAQKLKEVQEGSVLAPANAKVDAKIGEWGDNLQAFNKTTNIYYTIANDDANLYLVMKSSDQSTNNKIIGGGINFTINTANKKNVKDAFIIVFPQIDPAVLRGQIASFRGGMGGGGGAPAGSVSRVVVTDVATTKTATTTTNPNGPDSAAIAGMRKKAVAAFKEIKLIGFKDIPDSVISVYNEYGIKGLVDFDDKGSLAMELAIPLKYFNVKAGSEFAYNIKLNGINLDAIMPGASAMMSGMMGGGGGSFSGGGGMGGGDRVMVVSGSPSGMGGMGMPRGMGDIVGMLSPTDFWGKYVLAKK